MTRCRIAADAADAADAAGLGEIVGEIVDEAQDHHAIGAEGRGQRRLRL